MKNLKRTSLFVLLIIFSNMIEAQTIDSPYEVATWRGFTEAAITYTFDDGCPNQYVIAIPMLNKLNFNGTFFIVTTWSPKWSALRDAAAQGQEVASHTVTHPNLSKISEAEQKMELENSYDTIQAHIPGLHGMTMAYPYCVRGIDSLTSACYFAARGCQGFIERSTPADFLNISSIICGNLGAVKTFIDFKTKDEAAAASGGWCVYLIHGIDNDGGYSPLSSDTMRKGLEYLNVNRDKYWVETFGNVVRYIRERNSLFIKELETTGSAIRIQVGDTLPDGIYNYPVTIRRPLPEKWKNVTGWQNRKELSTKIVTSGQKNYVQFDVIPNKGEVTLKKNNQLVINP